jgi:hypothetical protein
MSVNFPGVGEVPCFDVLATPAVAAGSAYATTLVHLTPLVQHVVHRGGSEDPLGTMPEYFDFILYELVETFDDAAGYVDRSASLIYPTELLVADEHGARFPYIAILVPDTDVESPPSPAASYATTTSRVSLGISRGTTSAIDLIRQLARRYSSTAGFASDEGASSGDSEENPSIDSGSSGNSQEQS